MKLSKDFLKSLAINLPLSMRRQQAIENAKTVAPKFEGFVLLMDGRLEYYFGTEQCKQGYSKITFDPPSNRKRPNIPQYHHD